MNTISLQIAYHQGKELDFTSKGERLSVISPHVYDHSLWRKNFWEQTGDFLIATGAKLKKEAVISPAIISQETI